MNFNNRIRKLEARVEKVKTTLHSANTDIKRTSIYIPTDVCEKIQERADKNRRSFTKEALWLIEKGLDHQEG